MYPILKSLNINNFKLDNKTLNVVFEKNLLSEVSYVLINNNMNMNVDK